MRRILVLGNVGGQLHQSSGEQGTTVPIVQLEGITDRILPNGICMLPPTQSCDKGNACLTRASFAADSTHLEILKSQRKPAYVNNHKKHKKMANKNPNTENMIRAKKAQSAQKIAAVEKAIHSLVKGKSPISVVAVARQADVSPQFIYSQPELKSKIHKLRETKRGVRVVHEESAQETIVNALRLKIRNLEQQHKNEKAALQQELQEANKRIEILTAQVIQLMN